MKQEVECCKEEFISTPAFSKYMHKHLYSTLSRESLTETHRELGAGLSRTPTSTCIGSIALEIEEP